MTAKTPLTDSEQDAVVAFAERLEEMPLHTKATFPAIPRRARRPKVERVSDGWAFWNVPATGPQGHIAGLIFQDALDAAEAYALAVRPFFTS